MNVVAAHHPKHVLSLLLRTQLPAHTVCEVCLHLGACTNHCLVLRECCFQWWEEALPMSAKEARQICLRSHPLSVQSGSHSAPCRAAVPADVNILHVLKGRKVFTIWDQDLKHEAWNMKHRSCTRSRTQMFNTSYELAHVFIFLAIRASFHELTVQYKCRHKLLFGMLYNISPKECGESLTSVNYSLQFSCLAVLKSLPCSGELSTMVPPHSQCDDYSYPRLLKYKWSLINRSSHVWDCHPWSRLWRPEGGLRNGWPLVQAIDEELFFESLQTYWSPDYSGGTIKETLSQAEKGLQINLNDPYD